MSNSDLKMRRSNNFSNLVLRILNITTSLYGNIIPQNLKKVNTCNESNSSLPGRLLCGKAREVALPRPTTSFEVNCVAPVRPLAIGVHVPLAVLYDNQFFVHLARDTCIHFVLIAPFRALCDTIAQNFVFDFAIRKRGVFLVKFLLFADIAVNRFGGGGKVARLGERFAVFRPLLKIGTERDELMNISANIKNRDKLKRVYRFEPIATKSENFFVKRAVICVCRLYLERLYIADNLLGYIPPLFQKHPARSHAPDIKLTLVCIVSRGKQFRIAPNLFDDVLTLANDFAVIAIRYNVANIIAKRLFQRYGFRIKYHIMQWFTPLRTFSKFFAFCRMSANLESITIIP